MSYASFTNSPASTKLRHIRWRAGRFQPAPARIEWPRCWRWQQAPNLCSSPLRLIARPSSTVGWSEARQRTGNMMTMRLFQSPLTPFNQAFWPSTSCQKG